MHHFLKRKNSLIFLWKAQHFTFFRKKGSSSSYPAGPLPPCSQCDALLYNHSKENDMLITYHWKDKLGNEHIRVYHPDGSVFENGIDISSKYH